MTTSYCQSIVDQIHGELDAKYLFGNKTLLDLCLVAFLARGHVLLEGPPGTAKTMTAKLLAQLLSKTFRRIQFTSDMLPADIIGAHIYSPAKQEFEFIPGPIFADFILADEINRTPPRTQSALLEAMEERQVTVEGKRFSISPDFFVMATQNPHDYEGTFPLPESQLDRFIFKLYLSHASVDTDTDILRHPISGTLPPRFEEIQRLEVERERLDAEIESVAIDASLTTYIAQLLHESRNNAALTFGSSVRGGIALAKCSRILALLRGRNYVIPDDIKELAVPTLCHRVKLAPEAQIGGVTEDEVILEMLKRVEFPG